MYFADEEVLFAEEDITESYPGWRMYFDGGANSKGLGIGAVLISESGQHYTASAKIRFPCTNNMAEYEACILKIKMAVYMNIKELLVIRDSDLLIYQVQGEWSTNNIKILPYLHCVKELCKKFTKIEFKNRIQDVLATLSFMIQHPDKNNIDPIKVEIEDQHVYYFHIDEEPDASAYKAVTKKVVVDFVRNNIVYRFGIPESIITDNAANLNSDLMREICERFKIVHRNSIAYIPQMNGAVEAANKNIKRILRKIVDNHRQWHEKLSFALLEVEIQSLRVIQEAKLNDVEWIRVIQEQLMLIEEMRMDVVCHGQLYQNRMASAFNKRVKSRQFTPGQLVLGKSSPTRKKPKESILESNHWCEQSILYIANCLLNQSEYLVQNELLALPIGALKEYRNVELLLSSITNYNAMRDSKLISMSRIRAQFQNDQQNSNFSYLSSQATNSKLS
ncbi:uncharacterized protein [Nicotiana tomentosiformis]|uniref:uncharacterized protein n=1 Tax=Nicotiana tomentosiformis TaxID=4098 RepID=UPI00388CDA91